MIFGFRLKFQDAPITEMNLVDLSTLLIAHVKQCVSTSNKTIGAVLNPWIDQYSLWFN